MLGADMDLAGFRQSSPGTRSALSAAVVVAADDVGYLILVAQQRTGVGGRIVFVATLLAATVALVVTGVRTQRGAAFRTLVLSVAVTWCLVIGVLGVFSIGLPLLVAGGLSIYALTRAPVSMRAVIGGVLVGVAGLVVGFGITGGLTG